MAQEWSDTAGGSKADKVPLMSLKHGIMYPISHLDPRTAGTLSPLNPMPAKLQDPNHTNHKPQKNSKLRAPDAVNSKPQTLNPKPLHPKPPSLNPKPQIPRTAALNPKDKPRFPVNQQGRVLSVALQSPLV